MLRLQSALGLAVFLGIAFLLSKNRKAIRYRPVIWGLGLQLFLALLFIYFPGSTAVFSRLNQVVLALQDATSAGATFVFGYLGGGDPPFAETYPGSSYILAFQSLTLVLVMYALTSLFFHWGILQRVVKLFSFLLRKTLGVSGCESLGVSANIFVGMVEAPMFIRPYLEKITRSELFAIMVGGMATIAGTVMILYARFLSGVLENGIAHILIASIISAPAALTVAKIILPETGQPLEGQFDVPKTTSGAVDAITVGALEGMKLWLNIIAMLLVFVALIHLANTVLALLPGVYGAPVSLERVLGWFMAPLAFLMGIPWEESVTAGSLLGIKTILNELLAYLKLGQLDPSLLSDRSRLIITYALCGFANFGSLGIMIGGLGGLAPSRRSDVVSLGIYAIISGLLATMMTGAVIGMIGVF
jgi:CNT family concentrative nucleoside transporter